MASPNGNPISMSSPVLVVKEVQDVYVRKNFDNLTQYFSTQNQLLNFNFFEIEFDKATDNYRLAHGLNIAPRDVILTQLLGSVLVKFNNGLFTAQEIDITVSGPCRIRFYVGTYWNSKSSISLDKAAYTQFGSTPSDQIVTFTTGDVKLCLKVVADEGWVMMNDGTIGSAFSGATSRANSDTENLFTLIWNNISDAYAPVSGGRGSSAKADFASNKNIKLSTSLGRVFGLAGAGASLSDRALGQTVGAETHMLITAEMPVHTHVQNSHTHNIPARTGPGGSSHDTTSRLAAATATVTSDYTFTSMASATPTNQNAGGGAAHNNMQPTYFINAMIKL